MYNNTFLIGLRDPQQFSKPEHLTAIVLVFLYHFYGFLQFCIIGLRISMSQFIAMTKRSFPFSLAHPLPAHPVGATDGHSAPSGLEKLDTYFPL